MDDQSSVAGREDTARDQTVSSPQHPSAPHARPPTPDPPPADPAHVTHGLKPPSAAAAAAEAERAAGRPGKRAKLEEDVKHSMAAASLEGAEVGFDDSSEHNRGADVAHSLDAAGTSDKLDGLSSGGGAEGVGGLPWGGEGSLQGQGSGRGPEGSARGFKGSPQGPGKGKGATKGQRPSTAPVSPVAGSGKVVKPTRCQKCHTCRHKQLKKQCLRNKASFIILPCIITSAPPPLPTSPPPPYPWHYPLHHYLCTPLRPLLAPPSASSPSPGPPP